MVACGLRFKAGMWPVYSIRSALNCIVLLPSCHCYFFFFQAEDGIRDLIVTGVQTCALPIYTQPDWTMLHRGTWARAGRPIAAVEDDTILQFESFPTHDSVTWFGPAFREFAIEIGRASCRERV